MYKRQQAWSLIMNSDCVNHSRWSLYKYISLKKKKKKIDIVLTDPLITLLFEVRTGHYHHNVQLRKRIPCNTNKVTHLYVWTTLILRSRTNYSNYPSLAYIKSYSDSSASFHEANAPIGYNNFFKCELFSLLYLQFV